MKYFFLKHANILLNINDQYFQHDFIRGSRSQDRKIRIEIKDFIDRARRRRGMLDMEEEFGDGDEYDLAAVIQEEEKGDTLCEAPGATLRRNLTMMQGGEPSPVGKYTRIILN